MFKNVNCEPADLLWIEQMFAEPICNNYYNP